MKNSGENINVFVIYFNVFTEFFIYAEHSCMELMPSYQSSLLQTCGWYEGAGQKRKNKVI
jgi:hypothetical protein